MVAKLKRTGIVELRLAAGPVPHYREIVKLSGPILAVLVQEFGTKEVIKRFSDPLWLNCFACAVGFEWQFSGLTTVPLKAAKEALEKENLGLKIVGGKGRESKAVQQIPRVADELGLRERQVKQLEEASKLTCKVDTCELQDNQQLYFHVMLLDEKGNFTTINQKLSVEQGTVRRFHWIPNPKQFVEEPYQALVGKEQKAVLNLTSKESKECRKTILDLVRDEQPEKLERTLITLDRKRAQTTLLRFTGFRLVKLPYWLEIPKKLNLEALRIARELRPEKFRNLLLIRGMGPATLRGLAYISDLIYGTKSSFRDPIRYTFAFGTKANRPYPVQKKAMREVADILKQAVEEARLGKPEKLKAIRRLKRFLG
ncbi:MAG: hypothetical protein DRP12_02695 [Candidatus Aenigmatarchaeota archaeon]|nr:MAG: hypothetical protein DRP12_02695 [Candidatus Aenigmarchaeota archaeon]